MRIHVSHLGATVGSVASQESEIKTSQVHFPCAARILQSIQNRKMVHVSLFLSMRIENISEAGKNLDAENFESTHSSLSKVSKQHSPDPINEEMTLERMHPNCHTSLIHHFLFPSSEGLASSQSSLY